MVYLTNDEDLKKVADAIRAKSGETSPLIFPDGFAEAVENLPTEDHTLEDALVQRSITSYENDRVTVVASNSFRSYSGMKRLYFPNATHINGYSVAGCSSLPMIDLPKCEYIGDNAMAYCMVLSALILRRTDKICVLQSVNAFEGTPIAKGTGAVYVPDALVEQYKAASNWSTFADVIKPLSEYTAETV